ncbi:peripheral-type benzodiazepine receptor-associated protein 1-like isoform X12 [Chiloscyllium plagiosum]|uniref:peripheral-type benzodiazepine receptor-associated protein 1-like isoform X12 n=1 Tax=Chiloscyllium plagiosum TaxID=36176 RepID=UPI001CB7B945|nr:peripheral-type benzodiazepine receptor-associated protein 1-like isoform X12 [Chiloscyllium plagiosum]
MLAADPGAVSSFFTSEPGMEAQTEEERRSASQHPFVTSEGAPGHRSLCQNMNGWEMEAFQQNGTSYGSLVRHNTELLKAVKELEHTCITLREENTLLRKSSSPETEEKVKRLKRKNAELANIAKRLEERARKLQEANLRVVNSPVLAKGSNLEHYKKAFARQRAKDLSEHADIILAKDKQIEELRQECRDLHEKLEPSKEAPDRLKQSDFERVLRESQKEVLRLQRQLAVVSQREPSHQHNLGTPTVGIEFVHPALSLQVTTEFSRTSEGTELCKKRKECEGHEEEIKKRQRICEDLENELKQAWSENARLTEKTIRLSQEAQETEKIKTHNNDLRATLSVVTAERDSSLKENQRLQAKLENLEQVLKHMREVAERRHQLELEHEEALTILQAKQHEVERLQQAQFEAKKEHEGVVQLLENTLDCMQAKVRDLEEKCRSQSMQFSLLSQELEHFRLQAGNIDLLTSTLVSTEAPGLFSRGQPLLPNGVESPVAKDVESVPLPVPQPVQEEENQEEKPEDKQDEKQEGTQEEKQEEKQEQQEEQVVCEAKGQTISVAQQSEEAETEVGSITGKVGLESTHGSSRGTPKTESARSTPKSCMTPEIDTASEAEELDIDNVSSIPEPESRVTAKLKVFIARYSYNPFDGPNENPEAELPLTAGEYIYVYGDMDEDGFYEGELMDGRRGLVPSNFIERVSDEDMLTFHPPEINELSHSSFQEISFHSGSEKSLSLRKNSIEKLETSSLHEELSLHGSQLKPDSHVSNGLVLNTEEVAEYDEDVVPYPRKLNLIKQLAKSIIVSWESPLVPGGWGTIFSYNIYVDQELRMNVKFGSPTKAVIERLELNSKAYRIYVQSVTDKGNSDIICSSMLVGKDVCVAPTQLKVQTITATSADISWLPSNSNYTHVIFLNEEEYTVVKAGNYSYSLMNLRPNMKYKVKVEARPHQIPWELPPDRRQLKCTCTQFSTLPGGPPDAPLDIQIEASPSPGIVLISWLPVTIDAAGTSNGVRVTGYAVYVDGQKIIEVASPTAGSVLVRSSQIQLLQISKELTVRTMSPYGESADSSPVRIPRTLFTFPLHSVPLQSAPEICEHPEDSNSVRKQLSIADFKDEFDDLTEMVSDKGLNCQSATSYNGKEQGGYPTAFKTPGQVVDVMPNSISVTFEEPAPVQRENTKMEENVQDGAADLRHSCGVDKFEEQPKEDVEDLENSHMKRPVGSLEDFLVNLEKEEDPDVSNTYTKEDSDENILESDPNEQMLQTTKAIEALARTIPQESDDSVSPSNTRMTSIEEFLINSEFNQEKAHIPELGQVIEQSQFQSGDIPQQGDNTANHESEDYPLDSSRGSDLSDIMEEDEEELGSDTQMNEEIQQDCSLIRDTSLKGFTVNTDSVSHGLPDSPAVRGVHLKDSPSLKLRRGELSSSKASLVESSRSRETPILDGYNERSTKGAIDSGLVRIFVALFDYEPATMSPNPDAAEEELAFKEGQILKVFGDKDADGFYRGEANGQTGYVPCNMVSEIQVDDDGIVEQLLQRGYLAPSMSMEKLGSHMLSQPPRRTAPPPKPRRSKKVQSNKWEDTRKQERSRPGSGQQKLPMRRMVAVFDYDPRESSPNVDIEAELTFSAGDIITVYGDMDEDGFYYGDLNGLHGLAPSNFLEVIPGGETVEAAAGNIMSRLSPTVAHKEKQLSSDETAAPQPMVQETDYPAVTGLCMDNQGCSENTSNNKKKKGFFSKGKKLFKRLGSSKRE